ncbi:unnamed protein product [Sphagnum jensenii]|uniref:Uncharacterized protein n=1 Tax=Sphagnum jensenii TaxID=128206 RepID=A0ABP0WL85_9BRYO
MGQTHPEQHGSPAWTYISTVVFGIHNSFVEDGFQSANCDMQLGAFNSFKLVFIIIMHFLLFNSSMQLPGVGN